MRIRTRSLIAVLFILLLATSIMAATAIISSGGKIDSKIIDIKGAPIVGGNAKIKLGPIYYLLGSGSGEAGSKVPSGTVELKIERSGDDIKISWDTAKYPNPKLWYFPSGDGTGQYSNKFTSWAVIDSAAVGFDISNYNSGSVLHKNMVGAASQDKEVYYKGILSTVDTNTPAGQTTFKSAWAVGKVDVNTYKIGSSGWNFVATPLVLESLDKGVGIDFKTGDQLWFWDDSAQAFKAPVTFSSGTWGSNKLVPGSGYLFNLVGTSPKTITIVGKVETGQFSRSIQAKASGAPYSWNLIGNPYPKSSAMSGLTTGASIKGDQLWQWNNVQQKFLAPLTFNGANWPAGAKMQIGLAYGYNHTGSGFKWVLSGIK